MNLQDVIKSGAALNDSTAVEEMLGYGIAAIVASVLVIIIHSVCAALIERKERREKIAIPLMLIVPGIVMVTGIYLVNQKLNAEDAQIAEWRETVAIPYIESLPVNATPIHSAKEIQDKHSYDMPFLIEYRQNGVVKTLDPNEPIEILYDAENEADMRIDFYDVPEDLGHGFESGVQPITVHLMDGAQPE